MVSPKPMINSPNEDGPLNLYDIETPMALAARVPHVIAQCRTFLLTHKTPELRACCFTGWIWCHDVTTQMNVPKCHVWKSQYTSIYIYICTLHYVHIYMSCVYIHICPPFSNIFNLQPSCFFPRDTVMRCVAASGGVVSFRSMHLQQSESAGEVF